MNIEQVLNSAGVDRYHSNPFVANQPLSDHLWKVGILLDEFCRESEYSRNMMLAALTHDCPELITGDTPSPAKKIQPALKILLDKMEEDIMVDWGINYELSPQQYRTMKCCDVMEGIHYCALQVRLGNPLAIDTLDKWLSYWGKLPGKTKAMNEFVMDLRQGIL